MNILCKIFGHRATKHISWSYLLDSAINFTISPMFDNRGKKYIHKYLYCKRCKEKVCEEK